MAAADDHLPLDFAEPQPVALAHPTGRGRRRRDSAAVQVAARRALLDQRDIEPGP